MRMIRLEILYFSSFEPDSTHSGAEHISYLRSAWLTLCGAGAHLARYDLAHRDLTFDQAVRAEKSEEIYVGENLSEGKV